MNRIEAGEYEVYTSDYAIDELKRAAVLILATNLTNYMISKS
ncbi:hypothetical protein FACS1894200_14430 [Spirochaetia bacterium]|nr:hypothetical protein FACS1894200_14430 [Spirochaetia bacterium]